MKLSLKFLLIVFACPYAASNVAITTAGVPNGTKGNSLLCGHHRQRWLHSVQVGDRFRKLASWRRGEALYQY